MDLEHTHARLMAALKGIAEGRGLSDTVTVPPLGTRTKIFNALNDAVKHLDEAFAADNLDLVDAALKHRFGRRSERRPSQASPAAKPPRRRDEHGRSELPTHLPRREVLHDLSEAEKLCPCCGRMRVCIGEQTAEQLDMDPPRFFVLCTRKRSYACRHCDPATVSSEQRLATAGPAQVGPRAGPAALALVAPGLPVIEADPAEHDSGQHTQRDPHAKAPVVASDGGRPIATESTTRLGRVQSPLSLHGAPVPMNAGPVAVRDDPDRAGACRCSASAAIAR